MQTQPNKELNKAEQPQVAEQAQQPAAKNDIGSAYSCWAEIFESKPRQKAC